MISGNTRIVSKEATKLWAIHKWEEMGRRLHYKVIFWVPEIQEMNSKLKTHL
jgi:hypothetical protein